jgi:uncharacterized linocin/CFP29 family protein
MDTNSVIFQNGYMVPGQDILDPFRMRPYRNSKGESVIAQFAGQKVVQNADGTQTFAPIFKEKIIHQNALLRKYEWEVIDTAVMDVMRQPLIGIQDLISRGLTRPLGGIGVSVATYEQLSDMTPADISMNVTPRKGENDRVAFTPQSVPVPVISKPFTLDLRTLEASRRNGEGLDVTQARVATLKVREALEDMLFNGSTIQMQNFKVYGYTTAPNRITGTAASFGGGVWSAADGNAHKTITGMIAALIQKGFYGPFGVYVSPTPYAVSLGLTGANLTETQLSVIQRTIPDVAFVKRAPRLADGLIVVVQLTADVVDLAIGQDVTPLSWQEFGGLMSEFRVLTAAVPRIKFDANNACGVAVATNAK